MLTFHSFLIMKRKWRSWEKKSPPLSSTFPHALLLPAVHSTWLLLETSFFSASLIFPQNVQRRHQERHGVETDQWQWCVPLQLSHSALPYAIWWDHSLRLQIFSWASSEIIWLWSDLWHDHLGCLPARKASTSPLHVHETKYTSGGRDDQLNP